MTVTVYDLKHNRIKKLLDKERLSKKDVIDLLVYYHEDHPSKSKYTRKEIEAIFLYSWNHPKMYYTLEKARVYYNRMFGYVPITNTTNREAESFNDGVMVYSKDWELHVVENGKFKKVEYFN